MATSFPRRVMPMLSPSEARFTKCNSFRLASTTPIIRTHYPPETIRDDQRDARRCEWPTTNDYRLTTDSLGEPNLNIRTLLQVNAFDEAHFTGEQREDHRRSPRPFAEEADAFQQRAFGDACGSEDELLARS